MSWKPKRNLLLVALCWAASTVAQAEDPAVLFYTSGSAATTGLPGSKHGLFGGTIFDGQQRIGAIWHNRFVAVHLPPGVHVFSASLSSKHPADNSQTTVVLEADKTYFIRAQSEAWGIVVIGSSKGRLEEVPCTTAHQEAEKASPVEEKHIAPEFRAKALHETALPACH